MTNNTKWREPTSNDRNGERRLCLCSDGRARTGFFESGWWYFGGRAMRMPDATLSYCADMTMVTHCGEA